MTDLGGLSARLSLNTTGLVAGRTIAQGELLKVESAMLKTEAASTRLGGAFSRLGVGAKLLTGVLGVELVRKVGDGLKTSIEYATDLEATMARTRRVFGDSTDVVVKFADTADQKLGRTKDQALTASVRFGTLATRLGETKTQAAATSIALTKLATDLAASKGGTADDAANALATGLVGRGMALRRYGIVLTDTSLKEEAVKDGLMRSTKDALTPAIKLQAAYNVIMRQTADVQGYFGQHLDLVREKQQRATATITSASEALGKALLPAEREFADILANQVAPSLKVAGDAALWISDHRLAKDAVILGASVLAVAKGATVVHKMFTTLRDDLSNTFGHGANRDAIAAEGAAAERTAGQLGLLALAEKRAGAAALLAADDEAVLAAATRAGGMPVVPKVVTAPSSTVLAGGKYRFLKGAGLLGAGLIVGDAIDTLGQGSAAGQIGGDAARGAGAGAAIGSAVPVIGTAVGGVVGGVAGALYGLDQSNLLNQKGTPARAHLPGGGNLVPSFAGAATEAARLQAQAKAEAAQQAAAQQAVRAAAQQLQRMSPMGVATSNLIASRDALIRARQNARDPKVRAAELQTLAPMLGGAFDTLPVMTGDPNAIASANISVANAQARVDKLRAGSGSASPSSIMSAQAAVLSAEDTLRRHKGDTTAQTLRLQAAEARLNALRAGGKVDTKALATAEDQLHLARKKAAEASKGTALSAGDLLGRIGGQVSHTRLLAVDTAKLVHLGLTKPVLDEIDALEKTAPGTLDRTAHTMTRAMAASLNARYDDLANAQSNLLTNSLAAGISKAEAKDFAALRGYAAAQRQVYADALKGVGDPTTGLMLGGSPAPKGKGPATLESLFGSKTTTNYNLPNATIVANDPTAMARELERRARVSALAGMGQ